MHTYLWFGDSSYFMFCTFKVFLQIRTKLSLENKDK